MNIKNWKIGEIVFLCLTTLASILTFALVKNRNWLAFSCSIVGIVSMFSFSKGFVIAPILGVIYDAFYIAVAATQRFWGEVIIFAGIMLPVELASIFNWFKNKNKDNSALVTSNKISKKEWFILGSVIIASTVGLFFVLQALGTNQLVINTLSLAANGAGVYLMFRRNKYYSLAYCIDDLVSIVLWAMAVATAGVQFLPSLVCMISFALIDFYGFVVWTKKDKQAQQQSTKTQPDKNITEEKQA